MIQFRKLGLLAALLALPVAGCATAHETATGYDEILSELPADAPPGECYAKVVVPGQPIAQPPAVQSAVWVMRPGGPGMPGPIWCLVPTAPVPQPVVETVSRAGWIRVLCDTDTTPERVGHIQHELHDRGYYRGDYSGRYDRETVEAVTRFQAGAHIAHGGYLSLETVQALDAPGPSGYPTSYAPPPVVAYGYQSGYQSGYQQGASYSYGPPVQAGPCCAAPPVVYQQAYAPPPLPPQTYPCCAQAPVYGQQVYAQQAYGQQAYAQASASAQVSTQSYGYSTGYGGGYGFGAPSRGPVQNGWLVWNGKSGF